VLGEDSCPSGCFWVWPVDLRTQQSIFRHVSEDRLLGLGVAVAATRDLEGEQMTALTLPQASARQTHEQAAAVMPCGWVTGCALCVSLCSVCFRGI